MTPEEDDGCLQAKCGATTEYLKSLDEQGLPRTLTRLSHRLVVGDGVYGLADWGGGSSFQVEGLDGGL